MGFIPFILTINLLIDFQGFFLILKLLLDHRCAIKIDQILKEK